MSTVSDRMRFIIPVIVALIIAPLFYGCSRQPARAPRATAVGGEEEAEFARFVLAGHAGKVVRVRFAPRSNRIVSLSEDGYESSTLSFWHAPSGELLSSYPNRRYADRDVAFSRDGTTIGIGGGTVCLVDAETLRMRAAFEIETYEFLRTIALESSLYWPFAIRTYSVEQRQRYVTALAFSPDGRYVVSGHDNGQLKIWEVETGSLLSVVWATRVFGAFLDVEFSPDGRFIAACQDDRRVRVWRFPDYRERVLDARDRAVYALAFDPLSGRLAAAGASGKIRIWNVDSGREERLLGRLPAAIADLAFTGDGKHIAAAMRDNTVCVLNVATGKKVAVLVGHERRVNSVAFNSNATILASGGDDRTVRIWDISPLRLCDDPALTPRPFYPAILSGQAVFSDQSGDAVLGPGERGRITVRLENMGREAAYNIVTLVVPDTLAAVLEIAPPPLVPMLSPSASVDLQVTIINNGREPVSGVDCTVRVFESNGFHLSPPLRVRIGPLPRAGAE